MRLWLLGFVIALQAAPVAAQMVHTCVARDGHVTLTSAPCRASEVTAGSVHAPPERITPERQAELDRRRRQEDANSAWLERAAGFGTASRTRGAARSSTTTPDRHARCQAAKSRRDDARRSMGLDVRYETLRRLDDLVWDACR